MGRVELAISREISHCEFPVRRRIERSEELESVLLVAGTAIEREQEAKWRRTTAQQEEVDHWDYSAGTNLLVACISCITRNCLAAQNPWMRYSDGFGRHQPSP